ncbi:DUF6879 family protein [Nocardia sp. NPDC051787]|uniref:DUF6879 family protein n=1 Tax=Nocardia sp. NPDC051787 TaxID=3155415 RepID=UPI003438BA8A
MELFEEARTSEFHLEVRDTYVEPEESEPFRRFLNGEPEPVGGYDKSDWLDLIATATATATGQGITMSRVRGGHGPAFGLSPLVAKERLWPLATPYAEYVSTANVQR